jgi:hypothetical protein
VRVLFSIYEHRSEKIIEHRRFWMRQVHHFLLSGGVIVASLGVGAVGYHHIEHERWIDATYDAAMILTGMGPAIEPTTDAGRLFVTVYALFAGLVFLSAASILLAPAFHRVLHTLHAEGDEGPRPSDDPTPLRESAR